MNDVNRTLYIPLYGKAYVSRKGIILKDASAESIWAQQGFALGRKAKSKYLACYMGMRSAVFDDWLREQLAGKPAAVIHIGCGLDSRVLRVAHGNLPWYDVDFADVIAERRRYFVEENGYRMLAGDARRGEWLNQVSETGRAVVVMEGVSMYLAPAELAECIAALRAHFSGISLLMDVYTPFAARMSKYRNPINDVGVTQVYGVSDPRQAESGNFRFVRAHCMTPERYISQLSGAEKWIFRHLYAGKTAGKLYRLYEYRSQ